jgi:GTP cyclohydrolase IB
MDLSTNRNSNQELPDVSRLSEKVWGAPLDFVGMSEIQMPVMVDGLNLVANLKIGVNLTSPQQRGIHMSRLYKLLNSQLAGQELSFSKLKILLDEGIESQKPHSTHLELSVSLDLPLKRKSLVSGLEAWRSYKVAMSIMGNTEKTEYSQQVEVLYSSTCPASAALAWQAQEQAIAPSAFVATPHAQRSSIVVDARWMEVPSLSFCELIDAIEVALGTPVQSLVKREDEQEFARRNAENLMFCEDAARQVYHLLKNTLKIPRAKARIAHFESLHAHNAVAEFSY